jgi:hypothetical protein
MATVLFHVLAWPTFGIALLVFGFAPGAALRLIVLCYRRDNPRRRELISELYAVPRIERPFWVAEQMEVALFEGLRGRFAAIRRNRGIQILRVVVALTFAVFGFRPLAQVSLEPDEDRTLTIRVGFGKIHASLSEHLLDSCPNLSADDVSIDLGGHGRRGLPPDPADDGGGS